MLRINNRQPKRLLPPSVSRPRHVTDVMKILLRVYEQDSDTGARDLMRLYERQKDSKFNKDAFCDELVHRTKLFLLNPKANETLKVQQAIAGFVVECYQQHKDADVLDCVERVIEEYSDDRRAPDSTATFSFVSAILSLSLIPDCENDSNIPTVIDETVFRKLYQHIAEYGLAEDEEDAINAIAALKPFQTDSISKHFETKLQAKPIIFNGLASSCPKMRQVSLEAFCPSNEDEALIVFQMIEDPDLNVRHTATRKLIAGGLLIEIPQNYIVDLLKKTDLFITYDLESPMFDLLFQIADLAYLMFDSLSESNESDDIDTLSKRLKRIFNMQVSLGVANDMFPVMPYVFNYLRVKYGVNLPRFIDTYFACWPTAVQVASYKFVLFKFEPTPRDIHDTLLLLTTWLSMIKYACSPEEPLRRTAQAVLLPDRSDFADFFVDFWKQLGEWANYQANMTDIEMLLNAMAFYVFKVSHYLPRNPDEKDVWLKALTDVLADTSFTGSLQVIVPIVREWMDHAKKKPLEALSVVGAFLHGLLTKDNEENAPQRDVFTVTDVELDRTPEATLIRVVHILTGVVASGYFTKQSPLVSRAFGFIFKVFNHIPQNKVSLDLASVLTASLRVCPPERCLHTIRSILDKPEPFDPCFLDVLAFGINILGLDDINRIYFADGYQLPARLRNPYEPRCIVSLFLQLMDHPDEQIGLKSFSIIKDLLMFDNVDQFRRAGAKFLGYAFTKGLPFDRLQFVRRYWLYFATVSRDNQCRLVKYFVDLLRLEDGQDELDYTGMATFVVNSTAYTVLSKDAVNRQGTAHYTLIQELLTYVLSDITKTRHHSLISKVLDCCEYSNAVQPELLVELIAKATEVFNTVKTLKRISSILIHRLNWIRRYVTTNCVVTVNTESENCDRRLHLVLLSVEMNLESTSTAITEPHSDSNNDTTSDLNDENDEAAAKVRFKIFNGRSLTFTDLLNRYGRSFGGVTDDEFYEEASDVIRSTKKNSIAVSSAEAIACMCMLKPVHGGRTDGYHF